MSGAEYTIRRKVLTLLGAKFHIYNAEGKLIGFSQQKAFKLKEDIRVFTDESMTEERVAIRARKIIDWSAAYDVIDSRNQQKIGALRRKGWSSMMRDAWIVMDADDNEVGQVTEDSALMAMARRFVDFVATLFPQSYHLRDNMGAELASFRTHFNPFVHRMTVTVHESCTLSPILVLAAGVLLVAVEGRQA